MNPVRPDPVDRVWREYAERKFGVRLDRHEADVHLAQLVATQSEIEQVKYELVRDEGYRADQPIVVYRGPLGRVFIVDGHTRARVVWDTGGRTIRAVLLTSPSVELDVEFARIAEAVGGGRPRRIGEVPITDRLGVGSEAWHRRRQELLRDLHAECR